MRRIGRHKRNKQKQIIIVSTISLLLLLTIGYAAFSTNLSLTAKGNIEQLVVMKPVMEQEINLIKLLIKHMKWPKIPQLLIS